MRFRKHSLHLVAAVAMASSAVAVAGTGTASAATLAAVPQSCAVYVQGPVDPLSGNLPPNLLPLTWTDKSYSVAGEVTTGDGDKIIADLRNSTALAKRFYANLKINRTPVLEQIAAATAQPLTVNATTLQVQWKNSSSAQLAAPAFPTVTVFESGKLNAVATKIAAVKATASGLAAANPNQGASLGNVQVGTLNPPTFGTSTQKLQLNIARNTNAGTYKIKWSLGGTTVSTGPIAFNANAATIKANLDAVWGVVLPGIAPTVTVTDTQAQVASSVTLGPPITFIQGSDHVFRIDIESNVNPPGANPLLGRTLAYSLDTDVKTDPDGGGPAPLEVTGSTLSPLDAIVSNGAIWNNNQTAGQIGATGTYKGDPGVGIIADLGNNPVPFPAPGNGGPGSEDIYTANLVFANGPTGGAAGPLSTTNPNPPGMPLSKGVNTGKVNHVPDSQATIAVFSKGVILGINPNAGGNLAGANLALSAGIPLSTIDVSNQTCSLSALLGLFCQADPSQIPAAFSPFCTALADPEAASPSAPTGVTGATDATDGVDLAWTTPTYGVSGTDPGMALCNPGGISQCDVIDHYEFRASLDGKTWGTWQTIAGSGPASTNATLNKAAINTSNSLCGITNKVCLYQVRAENGLGVLALSPAPIAIHGQPGTVPNPGTKAK